VAYNFQTRNNKIKLLTEYESVTQKVLIPWTKCLWQIGNGGVYRPALTPAQSALCRHGGEGSYEQPSKQSFLVYLTAKKLV
jgi:hypothetical protein